ncbi:MAG: penicillin-binding protein 2 [Candidatus Pacebacteria bacterium]|nr:penicillin-binding protein 2 [Candidatus Paceibacterota bacterium]
MKNWRLNFILLLFLILGAAVIGRLVLIQVLKDDYYKALAQGQQKLFKTLKGERGSIFFKDGTILATNIKVKKTYVSPIEIENKEETAENLSMILSLEKSEIIEKINKENMFEEIKTGLTDFEVEELNKLKIPGVYITEESVRRYPQQFMASQVVGFLGGEGIGQYGVEGYYDDILQGKEILGKETMGVLAKGADIFLTLDYNIQYMAEKALEGAKKELNIEGGTIIVVEPDSGRILAMANYPNFDPNNYSEVTEFQAFQNSAVQKLYEPGSVFKVITMAGALDKDKINPQTSYVDTGQVKITEKYTITNYNRRAYGQQTMTEVLEKSINTGAVFAERQLGNEFFLDYVKRFGFFESTGIDLQGEVFSSNEELKKGYEINFATASFGQGIEVTPVQIIKAFCAIANGGRLINPHIVEKIINNGEIEEIKAEAERSSVISSKALSQLTAMMISAVENGFSKKAKVPGYYIAGKTGTSQISWSSLKVNKEGYSDKTWQSFIGFGPAYSAKFLILIKLDNPEANTAEYSAVPIFRELSKSIIDYLQIPPDYIE